jgi:hypothetical protein
MSFLVPKVCPVCGVKHLWDEIEELEINRTIEILTMSEIPK